MLYSNTVEISYSHPSVRATKMVHHITVDSDERLSPVGDGAQLIHDFCEALDAHPAFSNVEISYDQRHRLSPHWRTLATQDAPDE